MSSSWIETAQHPTRRELTRFGASIALALVVIAALRRRDPLTADILIAVAALFAGACVVAPSAMKHVYRGWMRFAEALGWINTRVLLVVIFYLVVTPIGLLMRLFRRSPLPDGRWTEPPRNSYGDKHYEKQF